MRSKKTKAKKPQKLKLFLDGVDWQHEIGNTNTTVYESAEHLKRKESCWQSCGIVEVTLEVKSVRWVHPQDLFKNVGDLVSVPIPDDVAAKLKADMAKARKTK